MWWCGAAPLYCILIYSLQVQLTSHGKVQLYLTQHRVLYRGSRKQAAASHLCLWDKSVYASGKMFTSDGSKRWPSTVTFDTLEAHSFQDTSRCMQDILAPCTAPCPGGHACINTARMPPRAHTFLVTWSRSRNHNMMCRRHAAGGVGVPCGRGAGWQHAHTPRATARTRCHARNTPLVSTWTHFLRG